MSLFMSRLGRTMVSWIPAPAGDGSRTVTVWTWEGVDPVQHKPFTVPSLDAARELVPAGAECSLDAPSWFAEEAWVYEDPADAVPGYAPAFETEPTVVLADPLFPRVRS